jgi:anti-sigma-K factor RskA
MIETQQQSDDVLLRRYALGLISADEQEIIEKRLLKEEDIFNQLLKAEEELAELYASGGLQGQEKERFESRFLNDPCWRKKVRFEKALNRYVATHTGRGPSQQQRQDLLPMSLSRWRLAMVATLLSSIAVLLASSLWLLRETTRLRQQVAQAQAQHSQDEQREREIALQLEREKDRVGKLEQELAGLRIHPNPKEAWVVSLLLKPGLSRAAGATSTANLSAATRELHLRLQIPDTPYPSYHAELQTVDGQVVWNRNGLKPFGTVRKSVVIVLPSTLLARSDYLVKLNSSTVSVTPEWTGTYSFVVVRK